MPDRTCNMPTRAAPRFSPRAASTWTQWLDAPAERTLGKHLLRFSDVVYQAGATSQPHLVCEHIYELARAFNSFYAECPVLDAEAATRESRLGLTALTARQIRRGLGLVGIGVVDRM
jgi:arginyl-tRNA synthetase